MTVKLAAPAAKLAAPAPKLAPIPHIAPAPKLAPPPTTIVHLSSNTVEAVRVELTREIVSQQQQPTRTSSLP